MSYRYIPTLPEVSNSTFSGIIPFGEAVLSLFRESPELLESPYKIRKLYGANQGWHAIDVAAFRNPIVEGLHQRSVNIDSLVPERDFTLWKAVIFPDPPPFIENRETWIAMNVRSYALVDLAIYYVQIANIYLPNIGLIKNLYTANVEADAIGRVIETRAEVAIRKIVKRYPISELDEQRVTKHVILLAKHDLRATQSVLGPRGVAFERECRQLLKAGGFDVQETPTSGDFGADLIASKDDLGFAIQCKDTSKPVGVKAIQEAVGARSHYKVDYAVVCSTALFTDAAIALATSNNVILSNARNLVDRLDSI